MLYIWRERETERAKEREEKRKANDQRAKLVAT